MSRKQWIGVVLSLGIALWPSAGSAYAAKVYFGTQESVNFIQPTKSGQYHLCYKTSTYHFILGCYIKDDGYVLQKVGDTKHYLPLNAESIRQLQQEGELPTPLPAYALSFFEYLFGYLNWVLLAFILGSALVQWVGAKARGQPSGAARGPYRPTPVTALSWRVGDQCLAEWPDGYYYAGVIRDSNGPEYHILFADGQLAWVRAEQLALLSLAAGTRVTARWQGGAVYYPGRVTQRRGERLHICYDDGDTEWTTNSLVRINRSTVRQMEGFRFPCPACDKGIRVPGRLAGRRIRCPNKACACLVEVPTPTDSGEEESPEPSASQSVWRTFGTAMIVLLIVLGIAAALILNKREENPERGVAAPPQEKLLEGVDPKMTSADADHGYSAQKPIKLGSPDEFGGPVASRAYLDSLRDAAGKAVQYQRVGSVGLSPDGHIMDLYEVTTTTGQKLQLYLDMYHPKNAPEKQLAPKGLYRAKK